MSEQQTAYRQIMKATSIFGGVQVFQIIIKIISSKFIALLLGPSGMGISGMLTSTTGFITALTNFGLSTSAVRDVAAAHSTGNELRVRTIVTVFRRLVWYTGLLGALLTLVLSPWLSQLSFGNMDYTYAFMIISVTLLINQLSAGQSVLLRGMRQIKYLAKSSVIGSILGLFTTIPLYYFLGVDGIVPGIIVTAITAYILTWYFARKLDLKPIYVTRLRTYAESRSMVNMGFMISLSSLITLGASYIVRIFISNTGGVDQVGLYNAGFAILNIYVGLLFNAMGTDYLPRLSSVANDNIKSKTIINQQAEVALLILSPIIMVFLIFIKWVIIILYSNSFLLVCDMIVYAALGMFFKVASWSIAFIFLAKGDNRLFFWNEFATNIYMLTFNLLGYKFWSLTGLGWSFLFSYALYFMQVYVVTKIRYGFKLDKKFIINFSLQLLIAVICILVNRFLAMPYSYVVGTVLIVISSSISYIILDRRIGFKSLIMRSIVKKSNEK